MTYTRDLTALKLRMFLEKWLQDHPSWAYSGPGWYHQRRSANDIASELLQNAEFGEVKLAGWLKSPNGAMARTVVGWVLPQPYGAEFTLLVEAIMLAAQAQQDDQRKLAGGLTIVAVATLALLLFGVLRSLEGNSA
jgi:hypothetical protein